MQRSALAPAQYPSPHAVVTPRSRVRVQFVASYPHSSKSRGSLEAVFVRPTNLRTLLEPAPGLRHNSRMSDDLRARLVTAALQWETAFGVAPAITSAVSEYDAAILIGSTAEAYGVSCSTRTAVSRGHDFIFQNKRYQVKANRPSGKPGSTVTLVNKPKNYDWDFLVWVLYDRAFQMREAWLWPVEQYRNQLGPKTRISPGDMRAGTRLFPAAAVDTASSSAQNHSFHAPQLHS